MINHATVDIETLDTGRGAVVLSVGACKFDPYSFAEPENGKHWRLNIDEQLAAGRTVSESTLAWWSKQEQSVKDEAFSDEDRMSVKDFAKEFNFWLKPAPKIWAQGPLFDIIILEDLYNTFGCTYAWKYWQVMDSRTLFSLMPKDPRKEIQVEAHNAMADAIVQSICVQRTFSFLLKLN